MAISGTLAFDPSQMAGLNPGANTSGSTLGPVGSSIAAPSVGGTSSPFVPAPVTGTNMPAYSSPYAPTGATANLMGQGTDPSLAGSTTFGRPTGMGFQDELAKSLQKSGYLGGVGTALSQFLSSGAGFSPQVAQALIAAMQPQIAKGQANLMEQFGSKGLAMGSPAALGLGDYLAQTNLDVGTLLSGLYEQSVQNYMGVLTGAKVDPSKQGGGILGSLGQLLPGIGQAAGDISSTLGVSGAAGTALDVIGAVL